MPKGYRVYIYQIHINNQTKIAKEEENAKIAKEQEGIKEEEAAAVNGEPKITIHVVEKFAQIHHPNCKPKIIGHNQT